jgi:hypothetical protein
MMMDHYSKSPTAVTVSEGTAFAQSDKKKKFDKEKGKSVAKEKDPKDFDKEFWKDKECYRCGKKGHHANACSVKPPKDDDDERSSKSGSKVNKDVLRSLRATGKALAQLGESAEFDDDLLRNNLMLNWDSLRQQVNIHLLLNPSHSLTIYYLTTSHQCTLCATKTSLLTFEILLIRWC